MFHVNLSTASAERTAAPTGRRVIAAAAAVAALVFALGAQFDVKAAAGATWASAGLKPNVLLVHGAFADGSSWNAVTRRLQADGYTVVASQIPLTSLADDAAVVRRDLRVLGGPTLIVGHSYGGAVVTQAVQGASNVVGLVYLAATAPDTGEAAGDFNRLAPPLPSAADFVPIDLPHVGENNAPFVVLAPAKFREDFCQDCSARRARLLAATAAPVNASAFGTPLTGTPAWKQFPAWYQISSRDHMINPAAQRIMARRMDPTGAHTIELRSGHASLITHPQQVAGFIERAAR